MNSSVILILLLVMFFIWLNDTGRLDSLITVLHANTGTSPITSGLIPLNQFGGLIPLPSIPPLYSGPSTNGGTSVP